MQGDIIDESTGNRYIPPSNTTNVNEADYVGPSVPLPGMPGSPNDGYNPQINNNNNNTNGQSSHDYNPTTGLTREQYRDLWMRSGVSNIQQLQAFLAQYGGSLLAANGQSMTPYGDSLDMLKDARTGNGTPAWTNTGGSNGSNGGYSGPSTSPLNPVPVAPVKPFYAGDSTRVFGRTTNSVAPVSNTQTVNSVPSANSNGTSNLSNTNAVYGPSSNTQNVPEFSSAFNRTQPQNEQQRPLAPDTNFANQFNNNYTAPSSAMQPNYSMYNAGRRY